MVVIKRPELRSELVLSEVLNFYVSVDCQSINSIDSDTNASIANMETAKNTNLESVISYVTNIHSCL